MIDRHYQRGLTLISLLFWGVIIVFLALLAMKLIPAYVEYFTIQKILRDIGSDPNIKNLSNNEIQDRFNNRAMIDNITTVKSSDLIIRRKGGQTIVSVEYPYKTKLIANISLLVEFSANSDSRESRIAQKLD